MLCAGQGFLFSFAVVGGGNGTCTREVWLGRSHLALATPIEGSEAQPLSRFSLSERIDRVVFLVGLGESEIRGRPTGFQ